MWSVGCIFAELLLKEPLFQAKGEVELISMIFKLLGPPSTEDWPSYSKLPLAKTINLPAPHPPQLRQKFPHITAAGIDLLSQLLTYDPEQRISAEEALKHPYFRSVTTGYLSGVPSLMCGIVNRLTQSTPICSARSLLPPPERSMFFRPPLQFLVISFVHQEKKAFRQSASSGASSRLQASHRVRYSIVARTDIHTSIRTTWDDYMGCCPTLLQSSFATPRQGQARHDRVVESPSRHGRGHRRDCHDWRRLLLSLLDLLDLWRSFDLCRRIGLLDHRWRIR